MIFPAGLSDHCECYVVSTVDAAYEIAERYNKPDHEAFA
jgi:hypothetical protein